MLHLSLIHISVYDASGNLNKTYDIVIYGDINGDGAVNALDMIKLNRQILGKGTLTGAYLEACLLYTSRCV